MTALSVVRELEFLCSSRYDNSVHTSWRIFFPKCLLVCPHQPQEPLSSLKSMAERAAMSSGIEGDVTSLHLTSGKTHTHLDKKRWRVTIEQKWKSCILMEQNVISPPTLSRLWTKTADDIIIPDSTPLFFLSISKTRIPLIVTSPHFLIQKYSPAALRPLQAPHQDLSPRCQKSASPHRWGCVRWGRFPCPKTRATNRPCRSRRGRICHTHPTPRESGAVKFLPPTFSAVRKSIVIHNTLQAASQTNNCLISEKARVKSAVKKINK